MQTYSNALLSTADGDILLSPVAVAAHNPHISCMMLKKINIS